MMGKYVKSIFRYLACRSNTARNLSKRHHFDASLFLTLAVQVSRGVGTCQLQAGAMGEKAAKSVEAFVRCWVYLVFFFFSWKHDIHSLELEE